MTMGDDPTGQGFDYEEIEAAVLETARGRWFLREYAGRNRSADTNLLLEAIGRIQGLLTLAGPAAPPMPAPAAAAVERKPGDIRDRLEMVQEAAWALRSSGARPSLCDDLDAHAAEALLLCDRQDAAVAGLRTAMRNLLPAGQDGARPAPAGGVGDGGRPALGTPARPAEAPAAGRPSSGPAGNPWRDEAARPLTLAEVDGWDLRDKLRFFT